MLTKKKRIQVMLEPADVEYLEKLSEIMGYSKSNLIRECVEQFLGPMRKAFGDELKADKVDAVGFMRVMMVEASNALKDAAYGLEALTKKR